MPCGAVAPVLDLQCLCAPLEVVPALSGRGRLFGLGVDALHSVVEIVGLQQRAGQGLATFDLRGRHRLCDGLAVFSGVVAGAVVLSGRCIV